MAFAFYACDWYNFGLPVQKRLLFMMKHTQRPMKMRALLVDMNLKTFLDVRNSFLNLSKFTVNIILLLFNYISFPDSAWRVQLLQSAA